MSDFGLSSTGLIDAARNGDDQALDRLLDQYRGYLKLLAQTQLDRRLQVRVSPSDLVQETLLHAYRTFNQFRGQQLSEVAAWLRTILARRISDQFRHHKAGKRDLHREQAIEDALDRSSMEMNRSLLSAEPSAATQADQAEQAIAVANALDRLPEDYRTVIVLREFQQLSFGMVAERMARTSGAVRMLWVRALERLRKEMESEP